MLVVSKELKKNLQKNRYKPNLEKKSNTTFKIVNRA